jgi:hypothetical protein
VRISVSRHLKVNLGNYESYDFGATATLGHGDMGYSDEEWAARVAENPNISQTLVDGLQEMAEKILDQLLIADIESAQGITEEHRSVVLRSFAPATAPASPTPRRSSGTNTAKPPSSGSSRSPRSSGYSASGA